MNLRKEIKKILIAEMATPSKEIKKRLWYHGTHNELSIEKIVRGGVKAQCSRSGFCSPQKGKVYITSDLAMALGYAFEEEMGISDFERLKKNVPSYKEGYIAVIDSKEITDVYPDEDQVGLLVCSRKNKYFTDLFDKFLADKKISPGLYYLLRRVLEPYRDFTLGEALKKIGNKYMYEWDFVAYIGKQILKLDIPDREMVKFIEETGNIAHKGTLHVIETYKITGKALKKMDRIEDFFKVAE